MYELTIAQMTLLLILGGAFVLFLTERIRIDLTAVLIILCLALTGILTPEEALSGFGSEPAIVAAAIFVLSGAMYTTGLSDRLGLWIGRLAGQRFQRVIAVIMTAVAALSAFTHHLTITAVMLPVTLRLSQKHKIPASHLLMPMSFAASLGTTITILGAPAFLIADRILRQAGAPGLSIFSIAPIGIAITIAGTAFVLIAGRRLLPTRVGNQQNAEERFQLNGYYTELVIPEKSPFIDRTVTELETKINNRFQLAGWLRHGRARPRPYHHQKLQVGDVLLVRTTPDELATIQQEPGIDLYPVVKYKNEERPTAARNGPSQQLVQAVVAPNSEFVGRTIGQVDFRQSYGVIVAGIWRRSGWLRAELSRVRLREGDVLLLVGDETAIARLERVKSFLMLVPFRGEPFMRHKASMAALILIGSVALAAFGVLSVVMALLLGAATAVLTGCLTPQQAYRAVDTRIYVFIAGVVPLGLAMQHTGTADLIAGGLYDFVAQWPPTLILFLLFTAAAILTQMMSDAGTVVLLGPVAVALALALRQRPEPYVVVVAVAAVASFLTPIGHHGNLLVYGPGGYQFSDFLKMGTPLTIIVALLTIVLAQLLWPG